MFDLNIQVLRAKIRGLMASSISLNQKLKKTSGKKRMSIREHKKQLGSQMRYHLIAYCLMKQIPYEKIERCSKDNRPNPHLVLEIMRQHGSKATPETIKLLLTDTQQPRESLV